LKDKDDYGLIVLADKRYKRKEYLDQLPGWIRQFIDSKTTDIATDAAVL